MPLLNWLPIKLSINILQWQYFSWLLENEGMGSRWNQLAAIDRIREHQLQAKIAMEFNNFDDPLNLDPTHLYLKI